MNYYITAIMFPAIGGIAGLLYGGSFLLQHKEIVQTIPRNSRAQTIAFFICRIGILFFLGKYLLRAALIVSIMTLISFFGMFWLTILYVKAKSYERI